MALLDSASSIQSNNRGIYELVTKKEWKGRLQTALLRKYKGAINIKYTFAQTVRADFEASVIITHSDPTIGNSHSLSLSHTIIPIKALAFMLY